METGTMPFEPGNNVNPNGRGAGKPFRDALRMELAAVGDDHKALRRIARNLIELASLAETTAMPAIKEIADRVDGKVPTPVGGTDELPPQAHTHVIERTIVDPSNPDGSGVQAATRPIPV
jgi:hypothetical protein